MKSDMKLDNNKSDLINDQYNQYWEMCRFHLSLSWNIPTLAIASIIAFVGLDPDKLNSWLNRPILSACILLLSSIFVGIMYIHHRRNLLFASQYERALETIEKRYGNHLGVLHHQVQNKFHGLNKLSSSSLLGGFILLFAALLFLLDIYFWVLVF